MSQVDYLRRFRIFLCDYKLTYRWTLTRRASRVRKDRTAIKLNCRLWAVIIREIGFCEIISLKYWYENFSYYLNLYFKSNLHSQTKKFISNWERKFAILFFYETNAKIEQKKSDWDIIQDFCEILSHSRSFPASVLFFLYSLRHLVYFARQLADTWTFV